MINRGYFMNKGALWNTIQVGSQVEIDHIGHAPHDGFRDTSNRSVSCLLRPVAVRPRLEISLEDRFQDQLQCTLDHSVADARNRKLASLPSFFRYLDLPQPSGSISPLHQLLAKLSEKSLQPSSFDRLERHPIDSRGSVVLLGKLIGFPESLPFADVDIQPPESPSRFSLRLDVKPSPQVLQFDGCFYHFTPASRVGQDLLCSKAPSLHGHYSASSLLRA